MTQINAKTQGFPRPIMERHDWMSLNGIWDFSYEDNLVEKPNKYVRKKLNMKIKVPFCYQSKASGINDLEIHERLRYRKMVELTQEQVSDTVLLHFGAVDYESYVWVNQEFAGYHKGGFNYFKCDITDHVKEGCNEIEVLVIDDYSRCKPRGKQYWEKDGQGCFYTSTSGIWRDVWLEFTGNKYIEQVKITPKLDDNRVVFDIDTNVKEATLEVEIFFKNEAIWKGTVVSNFNHARLSADLGDNGVYTHLYYWSPEIPNLYDVVIKVMDNGLVKDTIKTYFGMRKIHAEDGVIYLNNQPYYQRLVLKQGYWKDSLMTPLDEDALKKDVELIKNMGFNGIRMHQKIEDDRFYYWADKIGLLVWGEMPSAYEFNAHAMETTQHELIEFINQTYNHPSIITWVPLNESWGVRNILTSETQQNYARTLYYLIKSMDDTRLISTNDGWEQVSETDICGIHDYVVPEKKVLEKYNDMDAILKGSVQGRKIYAKNNSHQGQPIIISEFGGVSFADQEGWGYQNDAKTAEEYLQRLQELLSGIVKIPGVQGFCYTQFTDVIQETNGVLNNVREPKIDIEQIKNVFTQI